MSIRTILFEIFSRTLFQALQIQLHKREPFHRKPTIRVSHRKQKQLKLTENTFASLGMTLTLTNFNLDLEMTMTFQVNLMEYKRVCKNKGLFALDDNDTDF